MARLLLQRYWDIPDGTECHRKTYASTSIGGATAAIGAIFGVTSCVSAQVREKPDDPLNYFIGGCAGGLTLGARMHSYGMGTASCVCMGTAAALVKMGQLEGWKVFVEPKV
ncbi:NADH dehydrogenase [ubiquinone] 1 alpha subcomplex subunit 11 isoform 2-T2 [Dugong dugon]